MGERRPIRKLLIANRGEIAQRIMRTAESLGVSTVAVFSDADEGLPFVRRADEAVRIGPAASAESYLRTDRILDAAKRAGADAIHPGFGFLAENADFADAVRAAGLTFVGPQAEAIRRMGSKREAKAVAEEVGVPVLPGYRGADQSDAALIEAAKGVGYPLLVKASAGGGGKGMRIVRAEDELQPAIEGARREAERSFGDSTLLLERYLERPRHIEIQILGDAHGTVVHLHERECSVQRRHQKVLEEAPSPALTPELRAEMGAAAVRLGAALAYENAGTVEMLLGQDGGFYFLEVNTRLQVEHPVTDLVTGLDLVELQLRVAEGHPLPFDQAAIDARVRGWAVEARLYAEDPATDFLPQTGPVVAFDVPDVDWLRVDAGVEAGSDVTVHYDPMLAKVIASGPDRPTAVARLRRALSTMTVAGLPTNRDFLIRALATDDFVAGRLSTHFIAEHPELTVGPSDVAVLDAARVATLAAQAERLRDRGESLGSRSGFRNNFFAEQRQAFTFGERRVEVRYRDHGGGRFTVRVDDSEPVTLLRCGDDGRSITLEVDGHVRTFRWRRDGARHHVVTDEATVTLDEEPRFPDRSAGSAADGAVAPMPGQVVKVLVKEGDEVEARQGLLVMEAMKMEHTIAAPHGGTVTQVAVTEGQQVSEGALLVVVSEEE